MRKKISTGAIIIIAMLLLVVLLMDMAMMFRQIQQQTKAAGISKLEDINRELEDSIDEAVALTMEIAIESGRARSHKASVKKFLTDQMDELSKSGTDAFNVYMAGKDWAAIPKYVPPEDFVAQDRSWYRGAIREEGSVYITSPYKDMMTGNICYTASVMLGDGETVLAVDFTMDTIQTYVERIYNDGGYEAVIVTEDGIIAGYSDESLIGEQLTGGVPEFAGIWSLSKRRDGVVSASIKSDFLYDNLFAAKSDNGWILIISVNDWVLYRSSYMQLFVTVFLLFALFVTVLIAFFFARGGHDRPDEEELRRKKYEEDLKRQQEKKLNKRYRNGILAFMVLIMLLSFYTIVSATIHWGNVQMQYEAKRYENSLSNWISTQKCVLDMFVNTIALEPEMLEDYEGTIRYLNGMTKRYSDISATYMASPDREPSIYMNNGWKPEEDWEVEERPWYIGAMESKKGWSITTPYYDQRTGGYCLTISRKVHDARNGELLGVFGIDFYMENLVDILGDSFSSAGYAFLVDTEGNIINHPYGKYQMTEDNKVNVLELPYGKVKRDGRDIRIFRDYDESAKILLAIVNEPSQFSVYVVSNALRIYGRVILYGLLCLLSFLLCIVIIYRILSEMIAWQDEVNRKLEEAARTDAMTGLLNKASTEEVISQAVKKGTGAFLIIDLDSFKLVNDIYSHEMGDRILVRFSELIRSVVRDIDIVGRIGGDEFAVYYEGLTDGEAIRKKSDYLNTEILRSARQFMGSNMDIPLGCSIGAAFVPAEGRQYSVIFEKADLALHKVKQSGKHDVMVYQDQEAGNQEENSDLLTLQTIFGERNVRKTALVADRELFQNIYRYMVRLTSINGWNLHLVELTLKPEGKDKDGGKEEGRDENEAAATATGYTERFIELSSNLLRNCDVILKYNENQVVLMLMEPENTDFAIPVERVLKAWEREGVPGVEVSWQYEQVNKR